MKALYGFESHDLGDGHALFEGELPVELVPNSALFDEFWHLHPADFHEIEWFGRRVKTPRWQQAYGVDYRYTGQINKALPVPASLDPFLNWSKEIIDERLNGLLLNWYDAKLKHYIGPHHDSIDNLIEGTPIVTISLGAERSFRLTRSATPHSRFDFKAHHGTVFVMPWETNLVWKHSVPFLRRHTGCRISITLRAFLETRDPSHERESSIA